MDSMDTLRFLSSMFSLSFKRTAAVTLWLERPPRERDVVGSNPGRDRPKSIKLVVVAFPFGTQDYGNSTTTGPPVSG